MEGRIEIIGLAKDAGGLKFGRGEVPQIRIMGKSEKGWGFRCDMDQDAGLKRGQWLGIYDHCDLRELECWIGFSN